MLAVKVGKWKIQHRKNFLKKNEYVKNSHTVALPVSSEKIKRSNRKYD